MLKILIIISVLIVSNQTFAKSKCEREWNALKSVQAELRHKSSEYLRDKEHRTHNQYQDCRKGKDKKSKNHKTKSNQKTTYKKYSYAKYSTNNITNTVSLKGKFKDEKQDAWIQYYDKPKDCLFPESIKEFSKCLSYRDEEAKKFDMKWTANHNKKIKSTNWFFGKLVQKASLIKLTLDLVATPVNDTKKAF